MTKPCYHCHERPAGRCSLFCAECLPQEPAPLPLLPAPVSAMEVILISVLIILLSFAITISILE